MSTYNHHFTGREEMESASNPAATQDSAKSSKLGSIFTRRAARRASSVTSPNLSDHTMSPSFSPCVFERRHLSSASSQCTEEDTGEPSSVAAKEVQMFLTIDTMIANEEFKKLTQSEKEDLREEILCDDSMDALFSRQVASPQKREKVFSECK